MQSASLSGLDNLTHLGLRGGVDMRPTLLCVLTDLYVQKLTHTPDEERHYHGTRVAAAWRRGCSDARGHSGSAGAPSVAAGAGHSATGG